MKNLTAGDFKKSPRTKAVDIPELDGRVWVKAFTYAEMKSLSKSTSNDEMLILAVVGEDGKPLFDSDSIKNLDSMEFKDHIIEKLVDEILDFNNLKEDSAKKN